MKLAPIFSDHMVLQAGKPIRLFGTGAGTVSVRLGTAEKTETVGENWVVTLPPQPYGGPQALTVTLNGEPKCFSDVWLGDVLLLGGQSNMQFKLCESNFPQERYQGDEGLRLFTVDRLEEGETFFSADGWVVCTKENAGAFSAIGYHAGRLLRGKTGHAVGLLACYQGASVLQSWLPAGELDGTPYAIPWSQRTFDAVNPLYSRWNGDGVLYDAMLRTILPYGLGAVLWYQGESNSCSSDGWTERYGGMLRTLIDRWRHDFRDPGLLFDIVGLADMDGAPEPYWENVRHAQWETAQAVPGCLWTPSADLCETDTIHPPTKDRLGARIAAQLAAYLEGEQNFPHFPEKVEK